MSYLYFKCGNKLRSQDYNAQFRLITSISGMSEIMALFSVNVQNTN